MLMIRPPWPFIIGRAAARVNRNVPRRLMFSTRSHCSSFIRTIMPSRVMPALLTRMCRPPHACTTSSTDLAHPLAVGHVAGKGAAVPPSGRDGRHGLGQDVGLRCRRSATWPRRRPGFRRSSGPSPGRRRYHGHLAAQIGRNSALVSSVIVDRSSRGRNAAVRNVRRTTAALWHSTLRSIRRNRPRRTRPGPTS